MPPAASIPPAGRADHPRPAARVGFCFRILAKLRCVQAAHLSVWLVQYNSEKKQKEHPEKCSFYPSSRNLLAAGGKVDMKKEARHVMSR